MQIKNYVISFYIQHITRKEKKMQIHQVPGPSVYTNLLYYYVL